MSTQSSTRNLFPPLGNPELTIQRRPRVDPTLLNDFEIATNGNGDVVPLPGGGGTFMNRRPEEFYDLIENMTTHHNDWDTSVQRSENKKNLMKVLQINQQVKVVTHNCETFDGPHSYNDCPATVGQTQNVYAAGAYYQGVMVLLGRVPEPEDEASQLAVEESRLDEPELVMVLLGRVPEPEDEALSLPELSPTCMTLELADRSISRPVGVAEDVFVKVGTFHFSADFVVIDFDADPRVPLILGRSFLKTGHALIDVYEGELTLRIGRALIDVYEGELILRIGKEAVTLNLDQTLRYSANSDAMSVNRTDLIDVAYEDNFLFEETDAFRAIDDEPISPKIDGSYYDSEGDILLLE
nr:reverse transcriptase domain-containing protein [Tanacetum cinerariifolium]